MPEPNEKSIPPRHVETQTLSRLRINLARLSRVSANKSEYLKNALPLVAEYSHAAAAIVWQDDQHEQMPSGKSLVWLHSIGLSESDLHDESVFTRDVLLNARDAFNSNDVDICVPANSELANADFERQAVAMEAEKGSSEADARVAVPAETEPPLDPMRRWVIKHTQWLIPVDSDNSRFVLHLFLPQAAGPQSTLDPLSTLRQAVETHLDRVGTLQTNVQQPLDTTQREAEPLDIANVVTASIDQQRAAYAVVNELYRYFGRGRVVLAFCKGSTCQIAAVSNQSTFDRRAAELVALQRLGREVTRTQQPLWHPENDAQLPEAVQQLINNYYEASDAYSIGCVPLFSGSDNRPATGEVADMIQSTHQPGEVIGILFLEGTSAQWSEDDFLEQWAPVATVVSNACANAHRHAALFLQPLWKKLGQLANAYRGRRRLQNMALTGLAVLVLLALALIPADLRLRADGVIQPVNRARVYATTEGVVAKILVEDGDVVKAGDVLLLLNNPALEADLAQIEGQLLEAEERLRGFKLQRLQDAQIAENERDLLVRESASLQARIEKLREQFGLLKEKQAQLVVSSPVDGQVVTWDVLRRLQNRPVKAGQRLLTVADSEGPWELELRMPDRRSGYIPEVGSDQSTKTSYVLESHPTQIAFGRVREISRRADLDRDEGNVVRVFVDLDEHPSASGIRPRPGTEVIAHVHAGRSSLGYAKFFEFFDWIHRTVFRYF